MNCPRCSKSFDRDFSVDDLAALDPEHCPSCGARFERRISALLKTSTILISSDHTDGVYHSIEEVPERLREMLLQSTNSSNSGTILIADRGGKERISNAIRTLPSEAKGQRKRADTAEVGFGSRTLFGWPLRYWAGLLAVSSAGLLAWLISARH